MDGIVEDLLKERVKLLLMRGRGNDWEHTLRKALAEKLARNTGLLIQPEHRKFR